LLFVNQGILSKYDALVIGSGISGLTISLILAKEGRKVALFERDRDIAPLIRPFWRRDCECSPGLHILGWMDRGEAIASYFKYLNVADGVETRLNENGFGAIIIGHDKYYFPKGFNNVEKSLLTYFPECAAAVKNYLRLIKEVNERTFYINHKMTPDVNNGNELWGAYYYTLADCLKQYGASPKLIDLLGTFNYFLMGSKAEEVPFLVHAFVMGGYYHSPGIITSAGISRLLSNFKRELNRFGVDLFLKSEIDEIMIDDHRHVTGIKTLNGDQYSSSRIIASFNPKLLNDKLKPNTLRPIYRRRLNEAEITFGLYVAFYKVAAETELKIENLIFASRNMEIAVGATVNYSGKYKVLCVFLADNSKKYPVNVEEKTNQAKEKLELLEKIIYNKFPQLRGKIILLDYLKPWSFERYTGAINGSAYGLKHTFNFTGFQSNVPLRGLYLAGQAIYPGFLGSMISSFSLALKILESDNLWARVTNQ